jgi:hypothetical protein
VLRIFAELREGVRVGRTVTARSIVRAAFALLVLLAASPAAAQVYTERSYILPSGSVELTGTPARPTMLGMNISEDQPVFDPFVMPVHVYFGVTEELTLGVTNDRGPCFNCGDEQGDFYNAAGLGMGLLYPFVRKPTFELDLHTTAPLIPLFDPFFLSVRAGVLGRVNISKIVAFVFDPSLQVGLIGRDDGNREWLSMPVWFYFQATDVVVPFVGTAINGPLEGYGDNFQIPLEMGVIASVTKDIDLGGMLAFGNLMGRGGSFDFRGLAFLGRFRF